MLPFEMTAAARQDVGRRYLEGAERWLRLLAHVLLTDELGASYILEGPWKAALKEKVTVKIRSDPGAFRREIDATTFEQLIDIICHPNWYNKFSIGLEMAFPNTKEATRFYLEQLKNIRNKVSHGRQCSVRDIEKAICYTNDLSENVKNYMGIRNMGREYDVPTFVRLTDNLGNTEDLVQGGYYRTVNYSDDRAYKRLYPGDTLIIEVDVDPTYGEADYSVQWWLKTSPGAEGNGRIARIEITNAHVGERMEVQFSLTTNRDWHRSSSGDDDILDVYYKVLPPL